MNDLTEIKGKNAGAATTVSLTCLLRFWQGKLKLDFVTDENKRQIHISINNCNDSEFFYVH